MMNNLKNVIYPNNGIKLNHIKEQKYQYISTTGMNLEYILSKRSQTQRATCSMIPFLINIQKRESTEAKQMVVARDRWEE